MLSALAYGERRVREIVAQHGAAQFLDCQDDLLEYSRVKAREAFRRIKDGHYDFWDYLDDDLVTPFPRAYPGADIRRRMALSRWTSTAPIRRPCRPSTCRRSARAIPGCRCGWCRLR